MAHASTDLAVADVRAELKGAVHRFAYVLSLTVVVFVAVFVYWANQAVLDEVTRGDGKVIPSSRIQVVQNLEGGILSELLVSDGQVVQKDDVLLRIANSTAASDYRETRSQYFSLKGMIARLEAEVSGIPIAFAADVLAEAPEVAANETDLYRSRRQQLEAQLAVLDDQLTQRQHEIAELKGRIGQLGRSLDLARQELAITQPLLKTGAAAKIEAVRLQRQVTDLEGQIANTRQAIPRAEAALAEAQRRIEERNITYRTDATTELNQRRAQYAAIAEKIAGEADRVTRTEVRAPVRGTVKEVKVNTVGGVIRPGQDLVEIVPLEDTLLVEARIRPADIAFLHPGQDATIKITAYDFSIYGGLKAQLEQISADSIKDDKGESFFRVTLRTEKAHLGSETHPLPIISGMTATVEIMTGQKTVLDYLMKPILKARERALRER